MKKVIVPMALALAVTASGAVFAGSSHSALKADPTYATTRTMTPGTPSKAAMSDPSGTKAAHSAKIAWKNNNSPSEQHCTIMSDNCLFGPYGPEG